MITLREFFRNPTTGEEKPHLPEQEDAANTMLLRRQALRNDYYASTGRAPVIDPDTGTEISGRKGGSGGGGFRLETEEGSGRSSHKILFIQAMDGTWSRDPIRAQAGMDDYDPGNAFDRWLDLFEYTDGRNSKLEDHDLYRESPEDTPGWVHLTTRSPRSGRRTFKP